MTLWKSIAKYIKSLKITVEPLMFILAAANTAVGVLTPHLAKDKMKRVYPAPFNMTTKELDKFYSKKMVEWDNNYDYVNLPISCIAGIIFGGFSDRYGRKYPFLIGMFSMIVETAMRALIWSPKTDLSLYWLYPTAVVAGVLGDFLFTQACINAYVTDEFEEKKMLSIRLIVVQIMYSLGSFSAAQLTKLAKDTASRFIVLYICEGVYLLTVLIGFLLITNIVPENDEKKEQRGILKIISVSFISIYEAAKIFFVSREGHCRLFLVLCFISNFLNQFIFGEDKEIGGMIFGILVFKKLLHLRDTFVMCLGITSMGISVLIIGLAQKSWEIFASLGPGCLHGLINPMAYSFMSSIVDSTEIGKAFALNSICQKLSSLADSLILQNIYIATVDWCQGFVWYVMTLLSALSLSLYAAVHWISKKEGIGA